MADCNADAAVACGSDCRAAGKVAWPRLANAEVVPSMMFMVLVAVAMGVAMVVVVVQAGLVILLLCFTN